MQIDVPGETGATKEKSRPIPLSVEEHEEQCVASAGRRDAHKESHDRIGIATLAVNYCFFNDQ